MTKNRSRRLVFGWLVVASLATGCGSSKHDALELSPPDLEASKAALVASLDAWRANQRASGVTIGSAPAIGIVDAMRAERTLLEYEVVGPLMIVDKGRPFAVRLTLDGPRETITARYVVIGRDPLWVFRQEDLDRVLHWEHKMDPEAEAPLTESSTSGK